MNTTTTKTGTAATGTNLYVHLLLLIASLFGGMNPDTAGIIVGAGAGVVGAFFAVRNWVVNAHFSLNKSWLKDPNNWTYITTIVTGLIPAAVPLIPALKSVADAIAGGNLFAILTAAFTLISLAYYTFFKK